MEPTEAGAPAFRVIYFDAPTRGEQIRLLLHASSTPFEDVRVRPFPRGLNRYKRAAMGDDSPLAFDQVPCVVHDGVAIVQTVACMQFVGASVGLEPDSVADRARALMITQGSEEMRNKIFYGLFPVLILDAIAERLPLGVLAAAMRAWLRWRKRRPFARWCDRLETLLRNSDGSWFVGEAMSYADIAVFECLDAIKDTGCFDVAETATEYPRLAAFTTRVRALPAVQAYLSERGPVRLSWGPSA